MIRNRLDLAAVHLGRSPYDNHPLRDPVLDFLHVLPGVEDIAVHC